MEARVRENGKRRAGDGCSAERAAEKERQETMSKARRTTSTRSPAASYESEHSVSPDGLCDGLPPHVHCGDCTHFEDDVKELGMLGWCHRFPKSEYHAATYWCGEGRS
jgi:hypothetical protein